MAKDHVIRDGECISSVGFRYGFYPDTIWNHPKNAELRKLRENKNVLSAGDNVFIPEKNQKEVSKSTDQHHKFRRRGVPEKLKIRLLENGDPRPNVEYQIEIDRVSRDGKTDADGRLEEWIPPDAKRGCLIVSDDEPIDLKLGHLSPVDHDEGAKERLHNLGVLKDTSAVEKTVRMAIKQFQREKSLPVSGTFDQATRDRLVQDHGS